MKVLVITGSPHKNGTSALLAEKFIRGATEAGHTVVRFDAGQKHKQRRRENRNYDGEI